MTEIQHLLQKLCEECGEVIQEASKCNLFGLDDTYQDRGVNRERLAIELDDLQAVSAMLRERGLIPQSDPHRVAQKKLKVLKWMEHARSRGHLEKKESACNLS